MRRKDLLSWQYNMSFGYIPIIITLLTFQTIGQGIAVLIGLVIALMYSAYYVYNRKTKFPNIILYLSTSILMLVGIGEIIFPIGIPFIAFPMVLEISLIIPLLVLFLHKKRFINAYLNRKRKLLDKRKLNQGIESGFVSVNILLLLGLFHFVFSVICVMFFRPMSERLFFIVFTAFPPLILILAIVLNQISIIFFNKISKRVDYFPIINPQGGVIGKCLAEDVLDSKHPNELFPVIRIAVMHENMLYLCQRSPYFLLDKNKIDIPCESYLKFGESIEEGCKRTLDKYFPHGKDLSPTFSIRYHFQNEITNRLIYLFILDLKNETLLDSQRFVGGKLWSVQQIEHNLDHNFFSSCFENEFEYLKDIIDIREIYMES